MATLQAITSATRRRFDERARSDGFIDDEGFFTDTSDLADTTTCHVELELEVEEGML